MARIVALDVGTKYIGVAGADTSVPIATPIGAIMVDGSEVEAIRKMIADEGVSTAVIGYPRNQAGDATDQTAYSKAFGDKLTGACDIVYQDESLTSIMAEDRLKASGKPYEKADIDAMAATIILQDYLEMHYAA